MQWKLLHLRASLSNFVSSPRASRISIASKGTIDCLLLEKRGEAERRARKLGVEPQNTLKGFWRMRGNAIQSGKKLGWFTMRHKDKITISPLGGIHYERFMIFIMIFYDGARLASNALPVWRGLHYPFSGDCITRLAGTAKLDRLGICGRNGYKLRIEGE